MGKQCERRSNGLIPGQGEPWSQAEESGIPDDVKLLKFSESGSGTNVEFGEEDNDEQRMMKSLGLAPR